MLTATSYLVAFLTTSLVTTSAYLVLVLFKPITAGHPRRAIGPQFFVSALGAVGSVYIYSLIAEFSPLSIAYVMLLIPALYQLWNNQVRITQAKAGISRVRMILEAQGEKYDQRADLMSEQTASFGQIIGYVLGMAFFLEGAGLFA